MLDIKKLFTKIIQRINFHTTVINNTKYSASEVGTAWKYNNHPDLANWDVIAIQCCVHEQINVFWIARGDNAERCLIDNPSAGRFRGGFYIDWSNNRVGMRAISAGTSGTHANLIWYQMIYGIVPK